MSVVNTKRHEAMANISGKDFLNRITKVLNSELQRWEWSHVADLSPEGSEVTVRLLGVNREFVIEHSRGIFVVHAGPGADDLAVRMGDRIAKQLNGWKRDEQGNMIDPAKETAAA